ncbi:NADPH-dependent FMN reductase [Ornithinimicrobium sp. W1665]|uniref:NADPH-dependent FMN reductase n=1 Tax=Ornithinimicrobium sp. W1665 TaxID=3416666 RepID=UPI003CFB5BB8
MTKIAIVTGSVRPGRKSLEVAAWVKSLADARGDADFEVLDLADFELPVFAEPASPSMASPQSEAGQRWSTAVDGYDGYVFVVPEYNHSITGALKNAIDYLSPELQDKGAAFVSYGGVGGARAVEHLRVILSQMQMAHVRATVSLSLFHDFENFSTLAPTEPVVRSVGPMLDQLLRWTRAMEAVRGGKFDAEERSEAAA